MNNEQTEAFIRSIKECQQRSRQLIQTLLRVQQTLDSVQTTMSNIKETHQNIDRIKEEYGTVMDKLAKKIATSFGTSENPFTKVPGKIYDSKDLPRSVPVQLATIDLMKHQEILIITGAGVSAPSGIPTFRGQGGLYSKKFIHNDKQYEPEEFITSVFYHAHPQPIWEWLDWLYTLSLTSKPNSIHLLIDQLARELANRGKRVTVVTQNIDDLHIKPKEGHYEYYNVHGNVKYVRCNDMHLSQYASYKQGNTKCSKCQEPLRPHILFFDECYGQLYGQQVKDRNFPFAFVIGTSLKTNLCMKLAIQAKQIVEINPQPAIEVGKVYQYTQDTADVLRQFVEHVCKSK